MERYRKRYLTELKNNIIPFWVKYSCDRECGGFFTCLDRDGSVYDTEKFMWMQWRIVWMFSELYVKLEQNQQWLDLAWNGFKFLTKYGKDKEGRYYFSLLRNGTPAEAPYSAYSESFACMGAAALYRASGDERAKQEALSAFNQYSARRDNPGGQWNRDISPNKYQNLEHYMMQVHMSAVMHSCLGDDSYEKDVKDVGKYVFKTFWNVERKQLFENVKESGSFDTQSMIGRHLNPGHALESMVFLMREAKKRGDEKMTDMASEVILNTLKTSWDKKFGGIFYYLDASGRPHVKPEHSMKVWWVHCEALLAALTAYKYTGKAELREWFVRLDEWTWEHFPDLAEGEWFGYLDRHGDPTSMMKGGKWKSFYHLPKMLLHASELFVGIR